MPALNHSSEYRQLQISKLQGCRAAAELSGSQHEILRWLGCLHLNKPLFGYWRCLGLYEHSDVQSVDSRRLTFLVKRRKVLRALPGPISTSPWSASCLQLKMWSLSFSSCHHVTACCHASLPCWTLLLSKCTPYINLRPQVAFGGGISAQGQKT